MERREALRLLAAGTVLQLSPVKLLAALREARKVLDAQSVPRTLNPHQDATVKTIAESILPRTETPGATDVGVSAFVDLMLTEWYDERDRSRFLNGLADVDVRTQALLGKNFVDASAAQQAEILIDFGQKMAARADGTREPSIGNEPQSDHVHFYSRLRELTLTAYYTSEAGATQELHFEVIPDSHDECAPLPAAQGSPENQ